MCHGSPLYITLFFPFSFPPKHKSNDTPPLYLINLATFSFFFYTRFILFSEIVFTLYIVFLRVKLQKFQSQTKFDRLINKREKTVRK